MSNMSSLILRMQEFVDSSDQLSSDEMESILRHKFGEMFVDIGMDYYNSKDDSAYFEANDVYAYEELLDDLEPSFANLR